MVFLSQRALKRSQMMTRKARSEREIISRESCVYQVKGSELLKKKKEKRICFLEKISAMVA